MAKVNIIRWDDVNIVNTLLDSPDTAIINNIDVSGSGDTLSIGTTDAGSIIVSKTGGNFVVSGSSLLFGAKVTGSVDLPGGTSFSLDGASVSSANFTAVNLSRIFNGSVVDDLHTHTLAQLSGALSDVVLRDPDILYQFPCVLSLTGTNVVYLSGNTVNKANATNISQARIVGVVSGSTDVFYASGSMVNVFTVYGDNCNGFSGLVAGNVYYLSNVPGQISSTVSPGLQKVAVQVGIAKDSSNLVFQPLIVKA